VLKGETTEVCGALRDQQGWQVNAAESECKVVKIVREFHRKQTRLRCLKLFVGTITVDLHELVEAAAFLQRL
jgi:hypothetical protein